MPLVHVNDTAVDIIQTGTGSNIVMLHSLLAERSAFERVVPELAKNHRLTLVNLPGYGASAPHGASIEDYADHIAALMRVLALPPDTAVLGNGLGGFIALALACRHGESFGKLFIADALATFPPAGKEPLRQMAARVKSEGLGAVLDAAVNRMFPPAFIAPNPAVVAARKAALAKADPACFERACLALAQVDLRPLIGSIRNPARVIAGALDGATPAALVRELALGIPGAEFTEIPECGHCPQLEKPQYFVETVEAFLR